MDKTNETNYVPQDEYLENLLKLKAHIKSTVSEMLDSIDAGGDYEDKYNLQITCNGHTGYVELHADAFDRIMSMIDTELDEYIELQEARKDETR